jgi:hypothetical protein
MKPFVHFITSASEPLTAQDDMNFVKTKSLIYSSFHKTARYVDFEVGYPKDAKWFDSLSDKWTEYSNFYVGGFLEAIYSPDPSTTYIQVDAKMIDYDTRFRSSNTSTPNNQSPASSQKSPMNAFAQRRAKLSPNSPTTRIPRSDSVTMQDVQETGDDGSGDNGSNASAGMNSITVHEVHDDTSLTLTTPVSTTRVKRQLSDLCNDSDEPISEPVNELRHSGRGTGRRGIGRRGTGKRGKAKK